jgi:hypothetical protein
MHNRGSTRRDLYWDLPKIYGEASFEFKTNGWKSYIFAIWVHANAHITSVIQQQRGRETTQNVNGRALGKEPIEDNGHVMVNNTCVSEKRERVDAFV